MMLVLRPLLVPTCGAQRTCFESIDAAESRLSDEKDGEWLPDREWACCCFKAWKSCPSSSLSFAAGVPYWLHFSAVIAVLRDTKLV